MRRALIFQIFNSVPGMTPYLDKKGHPLGHSLNLSAIRFGGKTVADSVATTCLDGVAWRSIDASGRGAYHLSLQLHPSICYSGLSVRIRIKSQLLCQLSYAPGKDWPETGFGQQKQEDSNQNDALNTISRRCGNHQPLDRADSAFHNASC